VARSLNKVQLIGNLTRDPELRYTPSGKAVCTISLATNRQWVTEAGEKKEEVEFHRLVAWGKLAEVCSQFLRKGRKTFFEGRLQTRKWTGQDGAQRTTIEIIVSDMIILDTRREGETTGAGDFDIPEKAIEETPAVIEPAPAKASAGKSVEPSKKAKGTESLKPVEEESEDIPF